MTHAPQKLPEPFIASDDAIRLANLVADWKVSQSGSPTTDYVEGFSDAQRVTISLILAMGGVKDDSGCAPVASPNGFHPEK